MDEPLLSPGCILTLIVGVILAIAEVGGITVRLVEAVL